MRPAHLFPLLTLLASGASAQWIGHPTPGLPRTKAGKPNLTAKAPRTRDGKPDLSGVWHPQTTTLAEVRKFLGPDFDLIEVPGMGIETISKYGITLFPEDPGGISLMTPAGLAVFMKRAPLPPNVPTEELPSTYCLPLAVPVATNLSEVNKIVQTPGLIMMLLELNNSYRQIYTDGRPLPKDPSPSWMGYSTGRWEGDTLVVETIGFNDKGWLDVIGHPQSEQMRVTERYRRRDMGHMDVEYTFNDPKYYVRPFTVKITHELQPDTDILEYVCGENEKDRPHMGLK